jgi:hypothetical protein
MCNDKIMTGEEAQSSRWFESEQDLLTEITNSIAEGNFSMPTMFTIKRNNDGPGVIALILLDGCNESEELLPVDTIAEITQVVYACYGADAERVPINRFNREVEARSYHTQELIDLLIECDYDGVGLTSYIVYGSPLRPMRANWADIGGAVFIDADHRASGFYSYVVVPADLDKEVIDRYELTFVSRPSVK